MTNDATRANDLALPFNAAAVLAACSIEPHGRTGRAVAEVQRLSRELADALDEWAGGEFCAYVYPATHRRGVWFKNINLPEPVDPMLETITEYRRQVAVFAAIPDEVLTKDSEPAYVAATYEPTMDRLLNETPETTSIAGVREAIRLAFEESAFLCTLSEKCLRSALAYLDREVAS